MAVKRTDNAVQRMTILLKPGTGAPIHLINRIEKIEATAELKQS